MADKVETPAPESETSTAGKATPTDDLEAKVKSAREEARREAQAAKDREVAKLHREYQNQLAAERRFREAAKRRLKNAGDEDADSWLETEELRRKAELADNILAQQEATERWNAWTGETASAYGLAGSDERLQGATSAEDFVAKCKKAMADDARAERDRIKAEAEDASKRELNQKVSGGQLDSLTGSPAGNRSLETEYREKLARIPRGQVMAITNLQVEYRKKGLKI